MIETVTVEPNSVPRSRGQILVPGAVAGAPSEAPPGVRDAPPVPAPVAPHPGAGGAPRPEFPVPVADYNQWAAAWVAPDPPPAPAPGRPSAWSPRWLLDVVRAAVVAQRCNVVVLPDAYLAALRWGAGPVPRNWRQDATRALQDHPVLQPLLLEHAERDGAEDPFACGRADPTWRAGTASCPPACPLHGRAAAPHRHLLVRLSRRDLGALNRFAVQTLGPDYFEFDFTNPRMTAAQVGVRAGRLREDLKVRKQVLKHNGPYESAEWVAGAEGDVGALERELGGLRAGARTVREVRAVYLPARVFGPSPRSGLTPARANLLAALPGELTRAPGRALRPDRAAVFVAGPRAPARLWPGLAPGAYVAFNGTARGNRPHLQGHGFRPATWLARAGYPVAHDAPPGAGCAALLADLDALGGGFGVVVAGWHSGKREWRDLGALRALCESGPGRRWLSACVLRVYAPADFLPRWRAEFARRLGFASIPGDHAPAPAAPAAAAGPGVRSAEDLQVFMTARGLTDGGLADLLGVDRTTVNHYRTGRRPWSSLFEGRLEGVVARSGCDTTPGNPPGCDAELPGSGGGCDTSLPITAPAVVRKCSKNKHSGTGAPAT